MFYKTPISNSGPTGQKLAEIQERLFECKEAQQAMAKEYGFSRWQPALFSVVGGIFSVCFPQPPDPEAWYSFNAPGEYRPKLSTEAGKEIELKFNLMPTIEPYELNACVGIHQAVHGHIGLVLGNPDYYGFFVPKEWEFRPPPDCEQITSIEFSLLFHLTQKASNLMSNFNSYDK